MWPKIITDLCSSFAWLCRGDGDDDYYDYYDDDDYDDDDYDDDDYDDDYDDNENYFRVLQKLFQGFSKIVSGFFKNDFRVL